MPEGTEAPRWTIRAAGLADAERLAPFHLKCWVEAYRGIVPDHILDEMDTEERTRRWKSAMSEGRREVALAELGGPPGLLPQFGAAAIIGFASWGPSHDALVPGLPALELSSLYVAQRWWGSGLGASLLRRAIGDAPATLWVFDANVRARAFYAKHGFAPDGTRKVDERTGVPESRYVRR